MAEISFTDRVTNNKRGVGANSSGGFHNKRIQAGLSTQIVPVVVGEDGETYLIGSVQSLSIKETRPLQEIVEVGTDAIVAIVPNGATKYSISIDRIVFDFSRLPQALQREYRHIHAQRRPFDIRIYDYNPYLQYSAGGSSLFGAAQEGTGAANGGVDASPLTKPAHRGSTLETLAPAGFYTTLGNCWFEDISVEYRSGEYIVTERVTMKCEYIHDSDYPGKLIQDHDVIERRSSGAEGRFASIMSEFDTKKKE